MSIISLFRPPEGTPPKKERKAPAVKRTQTNRRTNFASLYPDSARVTMLISHNPKQPNSGAWTRCEGYKNGATVKEVMEGGVTYSDLAHDLGRRFILVTDQ